MPARRTFGATWWGGAWIDALEHNARLDPNRLPRGRTYARQARVGSMRVEPGVVRASVQGNRPAPYSVLVRVRRFTDAEWTLVLDVIAASAARAAALLDGEVDPGLVADAQSVDVSLLPTAGDVTTACSCPDWANPCKHAAAVCYLIADLLDADPFTILLLRGRSRDEVLDGIRSRRRPVTPAATAGAGATAGASSPSTSPRRAVPRPARRDVARTVPARGVWALAGRTRDEHTSIDQIARLDQIPRIALPAHPGTPAPLALDPPAASGIRRRDLTALAADAAGRAWALLAGDTGSALGLSRPHDLARRAAAATTARDLDDLAQAAAMPARRLAVHAEAWRLGGAEAVDLVDGTWAPRPELLLPARQALAELGVTVRVRDNRVSAGDFQLRLGRSGQWYRFERRNGAWELAAPPDSDPGELLLGAP